MALGKVSAHVLVQFKVEMPQVFAYNALKALRLPSDYGIVKEAMPSNYNDYDDAS